MGDDVQVIADRLRELVEEDEYKNVFMRKLLAMYKQRHGLIDFQSLGFDGPTQFFNECEDFVLTYDKVSLVTRGGQSAPTKVVGRLRKLILEDGFMRVYMRKLLAMYSHQHGRIDFIALGFSGPTEFFEAFPSDFVLHGDEKDQVSVRAGGADHLVLRGAPSNPPLAGDVRRWA